MLFELTIHNFGLIDKLTLEFDRGLNIFTGETGAGKSILIEALRIALGERMSSSIVRDSDKNCTIQAEFDLAGTELLTHETLQDFLTSGESSLLIQRTYQPDGKNKIKVNGLSATVSQLHQIGQHLMDFHGPHDHQLLLSSDEHLGMLDRLIDFGVKFEDYRTLFKDYRKVKQQIDDLQAQAATREREMDLLTHQVKELEQVPLDEERYQELLTEQTKINNAEKLSIAAAEALQYLDEDNGASESIRQAFSSLRSLEKTDESASTFSEQLEQIQTLLESLSLDLRDYGSGLSFDPQTAETVNARCDLYDDIQRKYGPSLEDARNFFEEAKEKLDLLSNFDKFFYKIPKTSSLNLFAYSCLSKVMHSH